MNRGELRQDVYDQVELEAEATSEFHARVNRHINRTLKDLAKKLPGAMFSKRVRLFTQPAVESADSTDTIELSEESTDSEEVWPASTYSPYNPWVFKTTLSVGSGTAWKTDRTWDGREIEIIESDGTVHRNVIGTVWRETEEGIDEYRFSVYHPWPHQGLGDGPFTWRLPAAKITMPQDYLSLKGIRLLKNNEYVNDIEVYEPEEARRKRMDSHVASGAEPYAAYREPHRVLQAPSVKPIAETVAVGVSEWTGPEPFGSFDYKLTYGMGKLDAEVAGPGPGLFYGEFGRPDISEDSIDTEDAYEDRLKLPRLESGPSPVSDSVTVAADAESGRAGAVKITVPNIEYVKGFLLRGTLGNDVTSGQMSRSSSQRSGIYVNIYRRRTAESYTNYSGLPTTSGAEKLAVTNLSRTDIRNQWFLLATIRIDTNNGGVFYDTGAILPDTDRPLESRGINRVMALYPAPDARYEIEIDYAAVPQDLVDDTDTLPVDESFHEALIEGVLWRVKRMINDDDWRLAKAGYESEVEQAKANAASMQPASQVSRKRSARRNRTRNSRRYQIGTSEA